MDLKRIMSNIYGESSSQTFDNVVLGGKRPIFRRARIHYLDEPDPTPTSSTPPSYRSYRYNDDDISEPPKSFVSFSGGSRTLNASETSTIFDSPMYISNPELQDFIKSFYLYYLFSHIKRNTIIIIPSSDELTKLKAEFKEKLSAGNITPETMEASKFANKENLGFKHYIFDVYGGSNNEKFDYKVDSNFPASASGTILRRTNRLGEVYFFKFNGPKDISVSCDPKLTNASKLTFVGKCANECFVLKGGFPKCNTSKSVYTVSGGGKTGLRDAFIRYCNKYNDFDTAAYKFIGALGLSAIENGEPPKDVANRLAQHYSADFIHSALSMIANGSKFALNNTKFKSGDINKMHKYIIDAYSPKQVNIEGGQVKNAVKNIYAKSKHFKGNERNKYIVTAIGKMYGNYPKSMFAADIGTAILRENETVDEDKVRHALNVMKAIENIYADGTEVDGNELVSTANAVYASFARTPFIGVNAKCSVPMLMCDSKKSIFKSKVRKQAFEDTEDVEGNAFEFKLGDNEEGDVGVVPDPTDVPNVENDQETQETNDDDFSLFY